jgi:hypothetical protein
MIPAMRELVRMSMSAPIVLVPDSLDECSIAADWDAGVVYLPLR